MSASDQSDFIDQLTGLPADGLVARLREQRPETLEYAQGSYVALLEPADPGGVSRQEREAIGLRVATLERFPEIADVHRQRLRLLDVSDELIAAIEHGPEGAELSDRMIAILRHTDMLTTSSRSGSPDAIASLQEAGLAARDIVTISQLIAYLSYQVRMVATLRAMAGHT